MKFHTKSEVYDMPDGLMYYTWLNGDVRGPSIKIRNYEGGSLGWHQKDLWDAPVFPFDINDVNSVGRMALTGKEVEFNLEAPYVPCCESDEAYFLVMGVPDCESLMESMMMGIEEVMP